MATARAPNQNKQRMNVDIVMDFSCPWCFIGKKRIEMVMKELESDFTFCVFLKPFLRWPNTPPEGGPPMTLTPSMEERWKLAKKAYKELGFKFKLRNPIKMPYTLYAHMLLEFVENKHGVTKKNEIAEVLLKAFFIKGKDNAYEIDNLIHTSAKNGIDVEGLRAYLENPSVASDTREKAMSWYEKGMCGVPFFLFNGIPGFSGAQEPQVYRHMILKIAERHPLDSSITQANL